MWKLLLTILIGLTAALEHQDSNLDAHVREIITRTPQDYAIMSPPMDKLLDGDPQREAAYKLPRASIQSLLRLMKANELRTFRHRGQALSLLEWMFFKWPPSLEEVEVANKAVCAWLVDDSKSVDPQPHIYLKFLGLHGNARSAAVIEEFIVDRPLAFQEWVKKDVLSKVYARVSKERPSPLTQDTAPEMKQEPLSKADQGSNAKESHLTNTTVPWPWIGAIAGLTSLVGFVIYIMAKRKA